MSFNKLPIVDEAVFAGTPIVTAGPEETVALGKAFGRTLSAGDVVALYGEMGSGKSTFVQGVCQALASDDTPTSPTFTLINEYHGRLPIYHFDFYRIESVAAARDLGCEAYFEEQGVCLIEWAEKIATLLPRRRFEVHFRHLFDDGLAPRREIRITTNENADG